LEKDNVANQKEKEGLYGQLNNLKNQRAELKKERDGLKNKIKELQDARDKIVVPDNPDDLVLLFRKLGILSTHRRQSR
jgi:uncharacterized coiled-coil DUF342 family protein